MSHLLSGMKAWALQRLSAVYLGLYLVYFVGVLLLAKPEGYAAWQQWLGQPLMSVATLVFVIALLLHTWIGLRDIFIDYVHPLSLRMVLMSLLLLSLIGFGLWAGKLLLLTGLS
mgnify:FL=1